MTVSGTEQTPEVAGIARSGRNAVIQLVLRTGALRIIAFAGTIVLARALQPADYGIFAVVVFVIGVLVPLGDLGMGAALIQQRERPTEIEMATNFTAQQAMWLTLLALCWLLAPLIHLAGPEIPADADWMIRITALAVYIAHLQSLPGAMMSRVLRFGPLATSEIVQQIVYLVVAVTFAVNGAGAWSFVLGVLAQSIVGTLLIYFAWGRLPPIGLERKALRSALGVGLPFQGMHLLGLVRESVVPLFGGLAGGVPAIGHLQFGQRLGRMVGGVDEIAARVAFPAFSRMQDDRVRLSRALIYVVETTALGLALVMFWAIAAAPVFIPLLFSERWAPAVPIFQLTAAAALLGPQTNFLRGIGLAAGRGRPLLIWSLVAGVAILLAFPFVIGALGLVGAGLCFLGYSTLLHVTFWHATRGVAVFPWAQMLRIYLLGALAGIAAAVTLLFIDGPLGLVISAAVFLAVYAALVLLLEREQLRRAWQLLRSGTVPDAT